MHCYAPSKVQQNIQKFEQGNVHNAQQQKAQKEHVCNHGQVSSKVAEFEAIAFINAFDSYCDKNAAQIQKMSNMTGGVIIFC